MRGGQENLFEKYEESAKNIEDSSKVHINQYGLEVHLNPETHIK